VHGVDYASARYVLAAYAVGSQSLMFAVSRSLPGM
jgi:hypothetical protein